MPMLIGVGLPLIPGKTDWPERAEYNFRAGEHFLVISCAGIKPHEVDAVRRDTPQFALVVQDGLIFFCFNFEGFMSWSDAPYTWWAVNEDERVLPAPPPTDEARSLLTIILVEAPLGIVRAVRALTLSPEFSRALLAAIAEDAGRGGIHPDYDARLRAVYQRFPTTGAMVRAAAVARCGGGE